MEENEKVMNRGGEPADSTLLLGITKASLSTDSFHLRRIIPGDYPSAHRSQHRRPSDHLRGLKENGIVGRLIPAGTGMPVYREVYLEKDEPVPVQPNLEDLLRVMQAVDNIAVDIFTAFVAVMERLIQLVSARARSRRELFKEIVDPIYVELTPVVEAYFVILSRTRDELSKATSADLQAITSELRSRRQHTARQSVTALIHEMQATSHDHQLLSFCSKVQGLFYSSHHSDDHQRMSPTRWKTNMGSGLRSLLFSGGTVGPHLRLFT